MGAPELPRYMLVMLLLRPALLLPPISPENTKRHWVDAEARDTLPEYTNFLTPGKGLDILVHCVLPNWAGHTGVISRPDVGGCRLRLVLVT